MTKLRMSGAFLLVVVALAVPVLLGVRSPARGGEEINGAWKLISCRDRDGNLVPQSTIGESRYTYDTGTGTMTLGIYTQGVLTQEFDFPFTVLGNGDIRFQEGELMLTLRPNVQGDTLTLTRQSFSGVDDETPTVPPYLDGEGTPNPVPPSPGPPLCLVMQRVP